MDRDREGKKEKDRDCSFLIVIGNYLVKKKKEKFVVIFRMMNT